MGLAYSNHPPVNPALLSPRMTTGCRRLRHPGSIRCTQSLRHDVRSSTSWPPSCSPSAALPCALRWIALDFLPDNASHHRFQGFAALLHEPAQGLVDERLIVPATGGMDLPTEPLQHIVVEANSDPGLPGRYRHDRPPFRLAEVIFLTHRLSPPCTGGARGASLC